MPRMRLPALDRRHREGNSGDGDLGVEGDVSGVAGEVVELLAADGGGIVAVDEVVPVAFGGAGFAAVGGAEGWIRPSDRPHPRMDFACAAVGDGAVGFVGIAGHGSSPVVVGWWLTWLQMKKG